MPGAARRIYVLRPRHGCSARPHRLSALRSKRDNARAKSALAELQRRAATTENLLPAILAAVEAYATVGEISDALRRVFGEYQESIII